MKDFTLFFDSEPGKMETGVAIALWGQVNANLTFRLYDREGNLVAMKTCHDFLTATIDPKDLLLEKKAFFIHELFPEIHRTECICCCRVEDWGSRFLSTCFAAIQKPRSLADMNASVYGCTTVTLHLVRLFTTSLCDFCRSTSTSVSSIL